MNDGGIYIFDSDWNNDVVHTLSKYGTYSGQFSSTGLTELVQESNERRMEYKLYAWLGIGVFAGILLLLILIIVRTASSRTPNISDD